jgi:hypothetical protein
MKLQRRIGAPLAVAAVVIAVAAAAVAGSRPTVAQEEPPVFTLPEEEPAPPIGEAPALEGDFALAGRSREVLERRAIEGWQFVELDMMPRDYRANWRMDGTYLVQDTAGLAGDPSAQRVAALGREVVGDGVRRISFSDSAYNIAGLISHYRGPNPGVASYYLFYTLNDGFEEGPRVVLQRVSAGAVTTLASVEAPGHSSFDWHTIELEVRGGELIGSLDGVELLRAVDANPLAEGRSGAYTLAMGGLKFADLVTLP